MAKIPTSEAGEYQIRPGVQPLADAGWGGVNTEDDPVSLRINELQRGQNIRKEGKHFKTRPGLIQKIDLAAVAGFPPGAVMWMAEAPIHSSPVNLWMSCVGDYGFSPPTGASIFQIESTASPPVRPYARIVSNVSRQVPLARYGGKLMIGDGPILRELIRVLVFPDGDADNRVPSMPCVALANIADHKIRCMLEFDGKLFLGYENVASPTDSRVVVWDGFELKNDLTTIRPPLAFGIWRNKLVCGFDATAGHIRVRDTGAVPGSWSTVAAASFSCSTFGNAMQEYRQYLYIASGNDKVYRFDGTTLALVRTIFECAADGNGCTSLALHNGLLFYGWNNDSGYSARLGRHDLDSTTTEWLDVYKILTADRPNFVLVGALASYRGQIYCAGRQEWVVATHHSDILGTVDVMRDTGSPSADYPPAQLLRF